MTRGQLDDEQRKLVEENMKLVPFIIGRYFGSIRQQDDDMMSVGYMALCFAALKFDPSRGIKFSTYAARVIINEMRDYAAQKFKAVIQTGMSETSLNIRPFDDDEDEIIDTIVDTDVDIEKEVFSKMTRDELRELAPLLSRRYFDGYSVNEIAREKRISKQAISYKMTVEGRRLKDKLSAYNPSIPVTAWTRATM